MKKQMKIVIKLVLAIVISVTNISTGNVFENTNANDELNNLVELAIDVDQDDLNESETIVNPNIKFDKIDRFNDHGIAIIGQVVGTNYDDSEIYKFGLINRKGHIIQPLEFDEINSFNNDYYLVSKLDSNYDKKQGLVSKNTGKTILKPVYEYIPNITGKKLIKLKEMVETPCESHMGDKNQTCYTYKTHFKSFSDGKFTDINIPDSLPYVLG